MVPVEAKSILEWYLEMGVDETIGDAPVNRYLFNPSPRESQAIPAFRPAARPPDPAAAPPEIAEKTGSRGMQALQQPQVSVSTADAVGFAQEAAAKSRDLESLREAMDGFEHCALKREASRLVFSDGNPASRVMIVGEAPGQEEDRAGKPFVGRAGKLLDRMFKAIGMSRGDREPGRMLYIANAVPWRPFGNRTPTPDELRVMYPFIAKHIELVAPEILVLMGNVPCRALIGKDKITRLRGNWQEYRGIQVMPMFHPAYLLRNPPAKMYAWWDLIEIKKRLEGAK